MLFPGQYFVLQERACARKVPSEFEKWDGMDHVNNGGNSCFIEDISVEGKRYGNFALWTNTIR